jgi:hypothetical protein
MELLSPNEHVYPHFRTSLVNDTSASIGCNGDLETWNLVLLSTGLQKRGWREKRGCGISYYLCRSASASMEHSWAPEEVD